MCGGGGGAGEVSVGRKTAESDRKCVILNRKINYFYFYFHNPQRR